MLLKSLEMFKNSVSHDWIYPDSIRALQELEYEEKFLERPFIGDQLDEALKLWHPDRAIVIAAPTGAGKTTFSVNKIVKRAVKKGQNILIVTNRNPLNIGYKKDVAKVVGCSDCYTLRGLQKEDKFGSIYVVNYQAFQGFFSSIKDIHFSYVIADECHYFLQDSTFSDCTHTVLKLIVEKFSDTIRMYISATIDEVLPFITKAEMKAKFGNDVNWLEQHPSYLKGLLPQVYRMKQDYEKINIYFYDNLDLLLDYLSTLSTQTMVFCEKIDECKDVVKKFETGVAVYAKYIKEHPEKREEIVENKGFIEHCLATTSVFSNGNNIKKKSVKSVIITLLDPVELIQMAGRRRLDYGDENDTFDLYVPIPTITKLEKELHKLEMKETKLKYYCHNYLALLRAIKDDCEDFELVRSVFEVDTETQRYKINELTMDKIYMNQRYLEFLYALISEKGPNAYCDLIATMFGKTFDPGMLFASYEDRKVELKKFIMSYSEEMSDDMFDDFKVEFFKKRIELFGKSSADNLGSNRKTPGINSMNNRLDELKMGIRFEKLGKKYRRVIIGDAEYE